VSLPIIFKAFGDIRVIIEKINPLTARKPGLFIAPFRPDDGKKAYTELAGGDDHENKEVSIIFPCGHSDRGFWLFGCSADSR
jgi:hypothetical protein